MTWQRAAVQVDGERFVDWASDEWLIVEGFDETERKAGRPFMLLHNTHGKHLRVECFKTLRAAKKFAESL